MLKESNTNCQVTVRLYLMLQYQDHNVSVMYVKLFFFPEIIEYFVTNISK